jgi:hypothetical protein
MAKVPAVSKVLKGVLKRIMAVLLKSRRFGVVELQASLVHNATSKSEDDATGVKNRERSRATLDSYNPLAAALRKDAP